MVGGKVHLLQKGCAVNSITNIENENSNDIQSLVDNLILNDKIVAMHY